MDDLFFPLFTEPGLCMNTRFFLHTQNRQLANHEKVFVRKKKKNYIWLGDVKFSSCLEDDIARFIS